VVVPVLSAARQTFFTLGDKFLLHGLEYKLAIGTVGKGGNRTASENEFVTAERK
jgi:hypothetical protein